MLPYLVKWADNINSLWSTIYLMAHTVLCDSGGRVLAIIKKSVYQVWTVVHALFLTDVCVSELLQTNLTSCLQLFIGGQVPSLIFADSLGLFIRQLVSPFAWFPVVNSSCLFYQRERKQKRLLTMSKVGQELKVCPNFCGETHLYPSILKHI